MDFYCHKLRLWIEIDDKSHDWRWEEDEIRTKYINSKWIKIIRYTNEEVLYNLEAVIIDLESKFEEIINYPPFLK